MHSVFEKVKNFTSHNTALSLALTNLVLALFAILVNDPFSWFEKRYSDADPFFSVAHRNITSFKISSARSGFTLVQTSANNWAVTENGTTVSADAEKTKDLLTTILNARKFTKVASGREKFPEFGLDLPISVEVFSQGQSLGILKIGSVTPRGNYTHVVFNDSEDIYQAENNLKNSLGRGEPGFFQNKKVMPTIEADKFSKIEIAFANQPSQSFVIERLNNKWQISSPVTGMAAEDKVYSVTNSFSSVFAEETLATIEQTLLKTDNKLDAKITFRTEQRLVQVTLHILGSIGDKLVVKREGDPSYYKISSYKMNNLFQINPQALLESR